MPNSAESGSDSEPYRKRLNSWLQKLGLHRPELRAWAMYDWANSAMLTTIITAVFPIYFARVACDGVFDVEVAGHWFARATVTGMVIIAAHLARPWYHGGPERSKETDARRLLDTWAGVGSRDVFHLSRRLGPGLDLVHPGQHRGQRQLRLLRRPSAARRP